MRAYASEILVEHSFEFVSEDVDGGHLVQDELVLWQRSDDLVDCEV